MRVALRAAATDRDQRRADAGEYVDMVEAGIVEPAKVTRSAQENAASIAALFLTTEVLDADKL